MVSNNLCLSLGLLFVLFLFSVDCAIFDSFRFINTRKQHPTEVDCVVVGSGLSGSTAAFYLHRNGLNVLLAECNDVVGGNLISKQGIWPIFSFVCLFVCLKLKVN
jgi:heterodisulfide reductase subunit A-like polyferredoxin